MISHPLQFLMSQFTPCDLTLQLHNLNMETETALTSVDLNVKKLKELLFND